MKVSIDVVIPTLNGWDLTERCLACLRAQTVTHSVIVADNDSTDGTPTRIQTDHPTVVLVETGGNLGFPVACNRGASAGKSDVVVLLNNDVEARPDFLERVVAPLERDSTVGSVAALLVRPGGKTIDSIGLTADITLAGFPRLAGRTIGDATRADPLLVGPSGGAAAYRRSAWEEAGGLDEHVFIYSEDLDLALRLRSAGWSAAAAPDAVGVHLGSATLGHRSPWQRYQSGFSRGYFLRRYGVLRTRAGGRTLATEGIVVVGDAVYSHDLSALRGRLAGWRAGAGLGKHRLPPPVALDRSIGFFESLRLRRGVYFG
jgi:N-acetylglucosaminyl-diphospho-decaprenol L-rhamnosyltransferase